MPPSEYNERPRTSRTIVANFKKIECAIRMLLKNDKYLLKNNSSERSITHKLAQYLELHYKRYDVDCEYNLNIDNERGKKAIQFLEAKFDRLSMPRQGRILPSGMIEVSVSPDIIIHKRGKNNQNKLIIEVKKQGCERDELEFDQTKLEFYTGDSCEFKYSQGYLVNLPHGRLLSNPAEVSLFTDGSLYAKKCLR